jgi:hypothetical protein
MPDLQQRYGSEDSSSKGGGCLKAAGIGCLVVILLMVVGGILTYVNRATIGRTVMGKSIEVVAEKALADLNFPEDEKNAILAPIKKLSAELRAGSITMDEMQAIGEEIMSERVLAAVGSRVFESVSATIPDLDATEREAARVDVSRFAHGIMEGDISAEEAENLLDLLTVPGTGSDNSPPKFRNDLTHEDFMRVMDSVAGKADDVGIPNEFFEIDAAEEVRAAIERGRNRFAEE